MEKLKGLYERLQKKSDNNLSRSSSNDYDYYNDKLTSMSQLNSSTKKKKMKKKKVTPEVFDNLYKTKTISAIHNSVNSNINTNTNTNTSNNNNNSSSTIFNKKVIVKKSLIKESVKINKSNINNSTDDTTNEDKNKKYVNNSIKCLECNRPYEINNIHNNNNNDNNNMRMKEIISNINDWKSSANFYSECLTKSIQELLTKIRDEKSLTVADNYNIDNIHNLCAIMSNIMNQNITHCCKKEIEDIVKKDFSLDNHHHNHNHHDNNKVHNRKENVIDRFLDFAVLTTSAELAVQRFFRMFLEVQKILVFDSKADASDDTTASVDFKNKSSPQTPLMMQRNKEELSNAIKNIKHDSIGSSDKIGKKCWIVSCIILNLIDDDKCSLGEAQTQGHLNYHSFTTAICALALLKYNDSSNGNGLTNDSDRINTMATATSEIIDLENNFDKLVQLVRCYRQLADEGVFIHLCIHQSSLFKMYQKSKSMYHSKKEIKSSYGAVPKNDKKVVKINAFEYFCLAHNIIPSLCDNFLVLRISQYVKSLAKRDLLYFLGCLGYVIFSVARDVNDPFGSVTEDISSTTSKVIYHILDSKNTHYNV